MRPRQRHCVYGGVKVRSFTGIALLLFCLLLLNGCVPPYVMRVQNQLAETAVLTCWDRDPGYVLWSVSIPARTTVKFDLGGDIRPNRDGFTRREIGDDYGFSYRGMDSHHEITTPTLRESLADPSWMATHTTEPSFSPRKRGMELILTKNDIVVVLTPKKVLEIELDKISEQKKAG